MARRFLLAVATSLLVLTVTVPASAGSTAWTSEVIDPDGGGYPDAVLSPTGPAVAYTLPKDSPSADELRYAYFQEGWQVEPVDNEVFSGTANPQLAFDENGDAWLLY